MASLSNYRYLVIEPGIANKLSKFGIKDVYGIAYLFGYFSIQTFFRGVLLNHKTHLIKQDIDIINVK